MSLVPDRQQNALGVSKDVCNRTPKSRLNSQLNSLVVRAQGVYYLVQFFLNGVVG